MRIVRRFYLLAFLFVLSSCAGENALEQREVITLSNAFDAEFTLIDHNGVAAPDERFEGKPMLIYFGFASCPDVCPAALSVMSATLDNLGAAASRIQPLFITIDPERDTPELLKAHLSFDDRILGLTGSVQETDAAVSAMKVYAEKVPMPDSELGYSMDHQSMFYLTDPDGQPIYAFLDSMAPSDLADAVESALKSM